MRLSLFLVPIALAALGTHAAAQNPPTQTPDLPTVIKPKAAAPTSKKPKLEPQPQTDPDAIPELVPDDAKSREPIKPEVKGGSDPSQPADLSGAPTGPDYTGPSILSRGTSFSRPAIPANERFRPFAGVNFYHDSGVTGKYQGPTAPIVNQTFTGADFNFGISGQHIRRLDAFELDYRGHAYVNSYSGQDHALAFGYSRVLRKRLILAISENAGLYANNYSVLNSVTGTDTSIGNTVLVVTPNTESFDDRTYYSTTQADLTFQKSSRLSFDIGSSVFYVKRATNNLISANGYQTRTDVAYRFSKRSTMGPYYAYSRYFYSGTFGDSGIHTVGVNYSYAINKRTQFRFRFGGSRLETRGLQLVVLSPVVAQILGVSTGTERYYSVSFSPDFAVDISRNFRHSDFTVSYLKGISPGNGVNLTSKRDSISVNYVYSGIRKYALTLGTGRDSLDSVAQAIGKYSSYYGRVSLSHTLRHNVQGLLNFDYRKIGFADNNTYARNQYRISVGLAYAPGAGPLKFW